MKYFYTILLLLATGLSQLSAQQDPMVSQYMFNGLLLNPAYAGSKEHISSALTMRNQWASFDGAPKTAIFAIDGALPSNNIGLGLLASYDKIGVTSSAELNLAYSYHINLGNGRLSLGLQGGIVNVTERLNELSLSETIHDPTLPKEKQNRLDPKVGAGIYYYIEDKFYVGLSVPSLLSYSSDKSQGVNLKGYSRYERHYYLTTGYSFELSDSFILKPFTLIRYVQNAPVELDINLLGVVDNSYSLGLGYRTTGSISILGNIVISERVRLGYAYTFEQQSATKPYGTHEVLLGYEIKPQSHRGYGSRRRF